jgi:hypothetical protein
MKSLKVLIRSSVDVDAYYGEYSALDRAAERAKITENGTVQWQFPSLIVRFFLHLLRNHRRPHSYSTKNQPLFLR